MSYVQSTPIVEYFSINGRRVAWVRFQETGAGSSSEWVVSGLGIRVGTIQISNCHLQSGSGANVRPSFGRKSGWSSTGIDDIGQVAASAAARNLDSVGMPFVLGARDSLYGKSNVNTGSDNTIAVELLIAEGVS